MLKPEGVTRMEHYDKYRSRRSKLPRKASSDNSIAARTKTDTGGQGEDPEVSERTVAKELGKMTPYVSKKECTEVPQ